MASAKFRFKGRAAHAGASPEAGRSALDAVELMNVGSNYVREHMLDQDRLHYVITKGGIAPNIVPAEAEVWYYIRAPHVDELGSLWKRLAKIAQGAAMMTETEVEHEILGGCYNTFPNKRLNRVLEENVLSFAGKIDFDDEDLRFARDVQQTLPRSQVAMTLAKMPLQENESVLNAAALPCFDSGTFVMGSTDVGDVAYIVPTSMIWGATWPLGVPNHSWQATACAGSSIGLKGMAFAAKALSGCIYDLVQNDSIVEEAKKEFALGMEGKTYRPLKDLLNASEDPNSAGGQGA
jgi:aminobenzoyl-glutamate utilization protein B